jgi:hypothetical protein
MSLVTFSPEQALDSFYGFPRTHEEQSTVLTKANMVEKDDVFHLEAETPIMFKNSFD